MPINYFINSATVLNWDSNFFSLKIASISLFNSDFLFLHKAIEDYNREGFDLLYLFYNAKCALPNNIFSPHLSILVDHKRVYSHNMHKNTEVSSCVCEFSGCPHLLYDLAFQAGVESRFKLDTNFGQKKFEKLYIKWVEESVKKVMADCIYVYKEEEKICGFVTLKLNMDDVTIGLIATDYACRGKKVGTALINAAKRYTWTKNRKELKVATQVTNIPACSFYEKNDFSVVSDTDIYHIWLKKQSYDSI